MDITSIAAAASFPSATAIRRTPSVSPQGLQRTLSLRAADIMPSRESLAQDTASFADEVGKKFREAGIQVPPNPILGNDFAGYVQVANNHPDKSRIEQLFKENPELRDQFAKISAQSSLLRAGEHASQYAGDYERLKGNPAGQSALVEAEIARNNVPFYMAITATGVEPFFSLTSNSRV